jgi:uncharacterized protein
VTASQTLLLPGWLNSGPSHWQSRWEAVHGFTRVDQHDWERPLRGDWIIQLEEAVLQTNPSAPVSLVAHSLGCILVAAWASVSRNTQRVDCALLVAPGDVEEAEILKASLHSWTPIPRAPLPFKSVLVASRNDPYSRIERSQSLATSWGSRFVDRGACGHINGDSGLGDWPQGLRLLRELQSEAGMANASVSISS